MARYLITSGPTREPLDPVRFLSNASSGRMGAELAAEALARGHEVDLVTGPVEHPPPRGVRVIDVITTEEMLEACLERHPACDVLIGAAAVCDYRPARRLDEKRRRSGEPWTVELVPAPDILATLGARKGRRLHVGFALETAELPAAVESAREKLRRKNLDWIVLNPAATIGSAGGEFRVLGATGAEIALGSLTKPALARALLDIIAGGVG